MSTVTALKTRNFTQDRPETASFLGESAICAISHWAPERVRTSEEVEADVTIPLPMPLDIAGRVGVKERHVVSPETSITDMAVCAAEKLFENRTFDGEEIDKDEIDLLIYFSVAREVAEPATAVFIQNRLGLEKVMAFDISDACIGFMDAWCVADAMIACGRIRKALLVSAERITGISNSAANEMNRGENPLLHYAALSLGDGATAILVGEKNPHEKQVRLVAGSRETFGKYSDYCILPSLDEPMLTHAGRLFNVALSKFPLLVNAALEQSGWEVDDIDTCISHQASLPSIRKGTSSLNIPWDKVYNTIEEYGNMASVSVPFTLSKCLEEQQEWKEQNILLVGFGSGLGVGVLTLKCV